METINIIENSIKRLKEKRFKDDKKRQYKLIATSLYSYFKATSTNKFNDKLILSFFERGFFAERTQQRHKKAIIDTLKENGFICDDITTKTTKQKRVYELKSDDKQSYMALMKSNGFNEVVYFVYESINGIPRRRKVATSRINGTPRDKNGEVVEEYDEVILKQTIPRSKQGVYSYGNKSIAYEPRRYTAKCYRVL